MTRSSEGRIGRSMPLLPAMWECPDVFRRRLGTQVGGQRLMQADGHMLLVVHAPPHSHQPERIGRFFWRDAKGEWLSSHHGGGPNAVMKLLGEYEKELEVFDHQERDAKAARDYFDLLTSITPLHRAICNLNSVLQEALKATDDDADLLAARDKVDEIQRRSDLLSSDVKYGLDYAVAARAEQQAEHSRRMAESSHRLNLLAAFFLPLVTMSAVFGVNLRSGVETLAPPWPFLLIVVAGVGMGAILTIVLFLKPRPSSSTL